MSIANGDAHKAAFGYQYHNTPNIFSIQSPTIPDVSGLMRPYVCTDCISYEFHFTTPFPQIQLPPPPIPLGTLNPEFQTLTPTTLINTAANPCCASHNLCAIQDNRDLYFSTHGTLLPPIAVAITTTTNLGS